MQKETMTVEKDSPEAVFDRLLLVYGATSQADLIRLLKAKSSTIKSWRARGVPLEHLVQAAEDAGCDLDWLRSGTGRPPSRLARAGHEQDPRAGEPYPSQRPTVLTTRHDDELYVIPRLQVRLGAGPGVQSFVEEVRGEMGFGREWMRRNLGRTSNGFASAIVDGRSMEPTLLDQQEVIVDRRQRDHVDGIYSLLHADELRVKRLQWLLSGALQIISDNPAYQSETIEPDAEFGAQIIGRVVWPPVR